MEKQGLELKLLIGFKVLAVAVVGYIVYSIFAGIFSPSDPWPPRDDADEDKIVATYKQRLLISDSPLSSRKPEDVPVWLARIIDCDVKRGNLNSAREYSLQALRQKQDEQVEKLAKNQDAKQLVGKLRDALKKQEALNELVGKYGQRPPENAPKVDKVRFDGELEARARLFCEIPFDRTACPEHAEEIEKVYRDKLEPAKKDPRLTKAIEEIEKNCRPRRPDDG
jgi:hypothetical protein